MTTFKYARGAEEPGLTLYWDEETSQDVWTPLDLSSGYTFELNLYSRGRAILTKTTGIAGAIGAVVVSWGVGELDIQRGTYALALRANETASGKDRDYDPGGVFIKIVDLT